MPEIKILDVNWSPSEPQSGEGIEFEVRVKNTTSSTVESVGVLVYVNDEVSHVPPNFDLEPGEERWTVKTGNNSFDPGGYDAKAVIDHVRDSLDKYDEYEFSITVGSDLGWVEGTVSSSTGESIDGYRVDLRGDNISTRQTRVDNGRFDFDDVPPGEYQLRGYMVGYEGFREDITVRENSGTTVDKTVSPEPYELTVDMTGGGGVGINPPGVSTFDRWVEEYDPGTEITLFANPDGGYEFVKWEGDVSHTDANSEEITFELDEDKEIIGTFEEEGPSEHTLTVNVGSGGSVSIDPPGVSVPDELVEEYDSETEVTVTANPDREYEFVEWEGDIPSVEGTDESVTVLIDSDKQLAVEFEEEEDLNARIEEVWIDTGGYAEGDGVNMSVEIYNSGPKEHEFFADFDVIDEDGNTYNNEGQAGRSVLIGPGDVTTVDLEWDVESDAPTGGYDAEFKIWKENDRDDLQTQLDEERKDNKFEIIREETLDYTVEARDARGQRIDGAEVTLSAPDGELSATLTAGETTFRDVKKGQYQLTVRSSEVNQTISTDVYVDETQSRRRVVFDPAHPISGGVLDTENWQVGTDVQLEMSGVEASPTTNRMGIYQTTERIPHDTVSITAPTTTSINHTHSEIGILDVELGDAPAGEEYISGSVEEVDALTSLVLQHAQTVYDYGTKLLAGLHGFVRGLISGFQEMVEAVKSVRDVVKAILSLGVWDVVELIISLFSDLIEHIYTGFQYLISAIMGVPDKYWEASESLADKQDEDNRYDHDDDRYMPFALGWFGGYSATGLIIGASIARGASAARSVLQRLDTFEDAISAASQYLRRTDEPDGVSPGLIGTFQNTKPQWYSDRTEGLTIHGSYMDIGTVNEVIRTGFARDDIVPDIRSRNPWSSEDAELLKEFMTSAHYHNYWSRGKNDPKDPAYRVKDERGNINKNRSGANVILEQSVAASLLKPLNSVNRIRMNRNDVSVNDISADHIWNSMHLARLQPGESTLIRNLESADSQFEFDYVRVVGRQQEKDGPIVPVVTHIIEPTNNRNKPASQRKSEKNENIDRLAQRLDDGQTRLPGTDLELAAFFREGRPTVIQIKARDHDDPDFDATLDADQDSLIKVSEAYKNADDFSRDDVNLVDLVITPPNTYEGN